MTDKTTDPLPNTLDALKIEIEAAPEDALEDAAEAAPEVTPEGVEIVSRIVYPNGTVMTQLGSALA